MKKLLAILAVTPLTVTGCLFGGGEEERIYYADLDPLTGDESDLYKEAHALLDGKRDYVESISSAVDNRSHVEDTLKIIEHMDEYMKYDLTDLVDLPHGQTLDIIKDGTIENVIMTSHGGPSYSNNASYFNSPWQIVYAATDDASLHGKKAPDLNGVAPAKEGYFMTVYIDANKSWREHGVPVSTGSIDDNPVAGEHYNAWFLEDPGTNWFPGDFEASHINVAVKQAQMFDDHFDDINEASKNGLMSMETMSDYNLRSVAMLEVATMKMAELAPNANLSFESHSFGALMAPLYLTTMGYLNETLPGREFHFDEFIVSASRLKFDTDIAVSLGNAYGGDFQSIEGRDGLFFYSMNEESVVQGNNTGWSQYKSWYEEMSDADKAAYDLARNDYYGGMEMDHFSDRMRSALLMAGHFANLDYGKILGTYGGSHVKDHAHFVHAGWDKNTGPLRSDERKLIQTHFASEVYDADASHTVNHFYDFTRDDSIWSIHKPTTAHVKLVA